MKTEIRDMHEIAGVVRFMWIGGNQWDVCRFDGYTWEYSTTICASLKSSVKRLWSVWRDESYERTYDEEQEASW